MWFTGNRGTRPAQSGERAEPPVATDRPVIAALAKARESNLHRVINCTTHATNLRKPRRNFDGHPINRRLTSRLPPMPMIRLRTKRRIDCIVMDSNSEAARAQTPEEMQARYASGHNRTPSFSGIVRKSAANPLAGSQSGVHGVARSSHGRSIQQNNQQPRPRRGSVRRR
jgi:hypothetical protein